MTFPIATVNTLPFCGACGWDLRENLNSDLFCDSCGSDFQASGPVGLLPPGKEGLSATPASGQVTFGWTSNPAADSDETSTSDDGLATWSVFAADTSTTVVSATAGTLVGIRIRSVLGAAKGPYQEFSAKTGA